MFVLSSCGLLFLIGFAYVFVSCFGFSVSDMFWKNVLMSGLPFLGSFSLSLSISLRFCSDDVLFAFFSGLFSRDKAQVVTGHTPHRAFLVFFLFFFVAPRLCYRLFWPCLPSLLLIGLCA